MDTESSTSTATRFGALLFAVLMVTSVVTPVASAAGPADEAPATAERADVAQIDDDPTDVQDDEPRDVQDDESTRAQDDGDGEKTGSDGGNATVAPATADADGTVEVVVRLEEADVPSNASDLPSQASDLPPQASDRAKQVQSMRTHAQDSQGTVVSFARTSDGVDLLKRFYLTNAVLLEVDTDRVNVERLAALDGVTRVHSNFEVSVPDPDESVDARPNESTPDGEATAAGANYDTTYGVDQINATEVWETFDTRGGGTKVAVLDTGVSADHPDIDLYTDDSDDPTYPGGWAEFDGSGEIVEGSEPHDTGYHGTHTSGTVSGGNASGEYVGVAPNVSLMHGLVLPGGSGSFAQIIGGMEWAVEQDADVISMSLGARGYYSELIDPVRNAEAAGTVVVAATGNDGSETSGGPGNVYESFAVGAVGSDGGVARFSSGEVVDTDGDWNYAAPSSWPDTYVVPDVAAPGVDVKSTVPKGAIGNAPNARYGYASGTSMATPHAAGMVALMLSAAERNGVDASIREVESTLADTAWKPEECFPDCSRDGPDTRYGNGIADGMAATSRLAGAQGVTGTVVDGDGEPMANATVSLPSGYSTATDADGQFRVRGTPGTYTLTTDAFGYEEVTETVDVPEGTFVSRQLALEETVEASVTADLPDAVRRGDVVATTVRVANADSLTVELTGEYSAANATLFVDGDAHEFGEAYELGDATTGEVQVSVATDANATGSFGLSTTATGLGDSATVTTGPTDVYGEIVEVAAVGSTAQGIRYGGELHASLDAGLSSQYDVTYVDNTEMANVTDEYDVFVVQKFPGGPDEVEALLDATEGPETGLVLLDNLGQRTSDAVPQVSRTTGNPDATDDASQFVFGGDNQVYYEVRQDHPVFEGVAGAGDAVPLYGSFYQVSSWFEGYDGTTVADVRNAGGVKGGGVAVDELSRTVLLSSMGYRNGAQNGLRTEMAHEVLANAVEYAGSVPPVAITADQPTQVAPGESIAVSATVQQLDEYTAEIAEGSTLSASDLSLYVDGEPAEFGESVDLGGVTSGEFTVEVVADDDAVGSVSLSHEFVAGSNDATITGTTATTAVYDPPLTVGDDVSTIQKAVDLAPRGATVLVENGTYDERVVVNATGLDLRPVFGESVTVRAPDDLSGESVVEVRGQDVTVSGFDVEAGGDNVGVYANDADGAVVEGVTVSDATKGVYSSGGDRVTLSDNTVRRANVGVEVEFFFNHRVTGNDVSDVDKGVRVSKSRGLHVANNTVTEARTVGLELLAGQTVSVNNTVSGPAVGAWLSSNGEIRDSTFTDVSTGIGVYRGLSVDVRNNAVRNASIGIDFYAGVTGAVRANEIDADTGVLFDRREEHDTSQFTPPYFDFDAIDFRHNDLSATTVATHNVNNGSDTVDARLNYFGPRGPTDPESAFVGPAVYDPFLTTPSPEGDDDGNVTAFGTDVRLPAGDEYALGIPGPTNRTVAGILGDDFEGEVYRYQSRGKPWVRADDSYVPSALEPLRVVPDEDTRAVLSVESSPSGDDERELVRGWNFVTAPTTDSVEDAFENSSDALVKAQPTRGGVTLSEPTGAFGPNGDLDGSYHFGRDGSGPNVTAFGGYFVLANGDGAVEPSLTGNSTIDDLYETAGVSPDEGVNVTVTPTASETFAESANATTGAQREAVVDAATAALADAPDQRAAIRENVSTALDAAPGVTVRAALEAATDEQAVAILAALDGTGTAPAVTEGATVDGYVASGNETADSDGTENSDDAAAVTAPSSALDSGRTVIAP